MKHNTLIICACGALLLTACGHGGGHAGEADGHAAEGKEHSDEIVIDTAEARASGIVVETVRPGEFSGVIPCGGKILAAQGDEATVTATVAGIVRLVRGVAEGSPVGKGAAVFTISSRNLQDDPARQAAIAYQKAKNEYERAAKLVGDRIVTQKEFNQIRADYEAAKAVYDAFSQDGARGEDRPDGREDFIQNRTYIRDRPRDGRIYRYGRTYGRDRRPDGVAAPLDNRRSSDGADRRHLRSAGVRR